MCPGKKQPASELDSGGLLLIEPSGSQSSSLLAGLELIADLLRSIFNGIAGFLSAGLNFFASFAGADLDGIPCFHRGFCNRLADLLSAFTDLLSTFFECG